MSSSASSGAAPLVLVDGSSYLYRAFHALPQLVTSGGEPTGAVRGMVSMLRRLLLDFPGCSIAVVMDASKRSFRNELYAEYKANRASMPDDLRAQVEPVQDFVRAMGITLLRVADVEADDVIGTLALQGAELGREVVISTGDKDLTQLVRPGVVWMNTMSDKTLDEAGVTEQFGVPPDRIIDYLALMGDSVDNIPGVPKVGPKTAAKWLNQYGTLDDVIANADQIKGKVGDNLRDSLEMLPLSRQLATIKCDVELEVGAGDLDQKPQDVDALRELYQRFEFVAWLAEIDDGGSVAPAADAIEANWNVLEADADPAALFQALGQSEAVGIHVVTDTGHAMGRVLGLALSAEPGTGTYVPFSEALREPLQNLLASDTVRTVSGDLKHDLSALARSGVELAGPIADVSLQSYVLDSVGSKHDLANLSAKHLGHTAAAVESILGKGKSAIGWTEVFVEQLGPFAAERADLALRLNGNLRGRLEGGQEQIYEEIEMPLLPVLSRVERNGALVDGDQLAVQSKEIGERIEALREQAWTLAGQEFNLDSTKQLGELLYDTLELPVLRKTPGGKPSTAEPVLQELALDYELPRVIMDYRQLAKLRSTYTDKLPLQINSETGRIHTTYQQAVAATGRLSSIDPNLQNIPIRTAEGRRIRQAFVAPAGYTLVALDYSQIELRIMAHLSGDDGLREAFANGLDIHRATAGEVFGVGVDGVDDDQRRSAKAINFGLIYGMSAFGLARQIGVARKVAQEYIERYFERFPGVEQYMQRTREQAKEQGYVETLFGRRLYLPDIRASNHARRQGAERQAINAPMQGTAADIIKRAMIAADGWLASAEVDARMIMQVHDELVLEVADADVETVVREITALMSGAADLSVPLLVDGGSGANWDVAH